jgi:hypothetical protein
MPFMKTNRKRLEMTNDHKYHIQSPANRAHPAARVGEELVVCV